VSLCRLARKCACIGKIRRAGTSKPYWVSGIQIRANGITAKCLDGGASSTRSTQQALSLSFKLQESVVAAKPIGPTPTIRIGLLIETEFGIIAPLWASPLASGEGATMAQQA
jgi:hypothetical protein